MPGEHSAITDVPGISVGHCTGTDAGTTVVLAASTTGQGVAGGVTQRGGAPGTRETDLLKSEKAVGTAHAVVLSGGSAYGLAASDGVMTCQESQGIGLPVANGAIVPSAILFDPGRCAPFTFRPDASFGAAACQAANDGPVAMGNIGAGAGARSGGTKGGIGTASALLPNGVVVGAIVAVNSASQTFNGTTGDFFANYILSPGDTTIAARPPATAQGPLPALPTELPDELLRATTIAVVATNVRLTKAQANKVAQMADDGMARAIRVAHGTGDGDTVFALATGTSTVAPNINQIGGAAADALSRAIVRALLAAEALAFPGCNVASYCSRFPSRCTQ